MSEDLGMAATVQIFVYMPDEAVDTWRPVEAELVALGVYRILSPDPDPDCEVWEFRSGELVRCEERAFQGGQVGLVATGRAKPSNYNRHWSGPARWAVRTASGVAPAAQCQ